MKIGRHLGISDDKLFSILKELLSYFHENFDENSVSALIGTSRELIIQEELGIEDPYEEIKNQSHKIGKKVAKQVEEHFDMTKSLFSQFRTLFIYAVQANSMEWFIRGHKPRIEDFLQLLKEGRSQIGIDETRELWKQVKKATKILYLLDNSGESEIDLLVIKFLNCMDKDVFIGAKSAPILNDITIEEVKSLGFGEFGKLVPTGQFVGTLIDERAPPPLRHTLKEVDLVIAKGMGSYETLSEYRRGIEPLVEIPCFIGLKAKCQPVADHIGVQRGELAIKRLF